MPDTENMLQKLYSCIPQNVLLTIIKCTLFVKGLLHISVDLMDITNYIIVGISGYCYCDAINSHYLINIICSYALCVCSCLVVNLFVSNQLLETLSACITLSFFSSSIQDMENSHMVTIYA